MTPNEIERVKIGSLVCAEKQRGMMGIVVSLEQNDEEPYDEKDLISLRAGEWKRFGVVWFYDAKYVHHYSNWFLQYWELLSE